MHPGAPKDGRLQVYYSEILDQDSIRRNDEINKDAGQARQKVSAANAAESRARLTA